MRRPRRARLCAGPGGGRACGGSRTAGSPPSRHPRRTTRPSPRAARDGGPPGRAAFRKAVKRHLGFQRLAARSQAPALVRSGQRAAEEHDLARGLRRRPPARLPNERATAAPPLRGRANGRPRQKARPRFSWQLSCRLARCPARTHLPGGVGRLRRPGPGTSWLVPSGRQGRENCTTSLTSALRQQDPGRALAAIRKPYAFHTRSIRRFPGA